MYKPFSDSYMRYDKSSHRYVLTDRYLKEIMNVDIDALIDTSVCIDVYKEKSIFLDRISSVIYSYIYRSCVHYYAKERELAMDRSLRLPILKAMEEQVRYVIFNGDLSLAGGVNVFEGTAIENSRLRRSEIAPIAKDILIGVGIVSIGVPRFQTEIEPHYEEEGY